jgi:aquaporin Z
MNHLKPVVAELIGTFFLCFAGAGSIIANYYSGGSLGLTGIALAHGLALSIAISCTMGISGGQINPAVTIGLMAIGKESICRGVRLILAQLTGAAIAGALLVLLLPSEAVDAVGLGTPALVDDIGLGAGIALEAIGTFMLAFAVYGTAVGSKAPKGLGGFGIGLTVAFSIMAIGPFTGAAFNPARHFGTALFSGQIGMNWLYWIGPVLGSVVAFVIAHWALEDKSVNE